MRGRLLYLMEAIENKMYSQATIKRNIIPRNGAYRIVNRDVHFCTPPCSSLRSKNYTSLGRITLDTATEKNVIFMWLVVFINA